MYIELYFLDNLLMDALILRLAAAVTRRSVPFWRLFALSAAGALYASLAVTCLEWLMLPPLKLLLLLIMALALPFGSIKEYLTGALCVFLASATLGGIAVACSAFFGASVQDGVILAPLSVRVALGTAAVAAFLPRCIRSAQRRRALKHPRVRVEHKGVVVELRAIVDSGNLLREPISGKCVVIMNADELLRFAVLPIPCATPAGNAVLYGFRPERLIIGGRSRTPADAYVALTTQKLDGALVPTAAIPLDLDADCKEETPC
ncbi:MAG: sigma-E processing peptidase SpoIIGA [Clostridia bacterium]|nr:sigma-E processing peptidase SpoIIGA [Clostridia bacterium]